MYTVSAMGADSVLSEVERRFTGRKVVRIDRSPEMTPAAVLVPIVEVRGEAALLFTERSEHVTDHKGQVSFPGGRIEPTDADEEAAALRETEEEIGVDRASVRVVGALDDAVTITGFRITPIVGIVSHQGPWNCNAAEIRSVFTVPIAQLVSPGVYRSAAFELEIRGNLVTLPAFVAGPHRIWGATCRIVLEFLDVAFGWRPSEIK